MASFAASSVSFRAVSASLKLNQVSNLGKVSLSFGGKGFLPHRSPALRFRVSCAAKPETVDKVVEIVKRQLALPEDHIVSGESEFATLGADSLDTVEIVMGLEEEFGISVEEEHAQNITTVQDAADLIEELLEKPKDLIEEILEKPEELIEEILEKPQDLIEEILEKPQD